MDHSSSAKQVNYGTVRGLIWAEERIRRAQDYERKEWGKKIEGANICGFAYYIETIERVKRSGRGNREYERKKGGIFLREFRQN